MVRFAPCYQRVGVAQGSLELGGFAEVGRRGKKTSFIRSVPKKRRKCLVDENYSVIFNEPDRSGYGVEYGPVLFGTVGPICRVQFGNYGLRATCGCRLRTK